MCSSSKHAGGGCEAAERVPERELCVTQVQRYSLHDGGGIRSVVFCKGCPFTCPWCCNPENLSFEPQVMWKKSLCIGCSVRADGMRGANGCPCDTDPAACPTGAKELMGQQRTVTSLVDELQRDRIFYEESGGGITVSGGECLAGAVRQKAVLELLERTHDAGTSTALETTLAVKLAVDPERLARACDVFLVDFKIADRERSLDVLKLDTAVRDANLRAVLAAGARVVARMPIIPGFTDSDQNVLSNARRIIELGIARADILPFHQLGESKYASLGLPYSMADIDQVTDEAVEHAAELCRQQGLEVVVRGE